MSTNIIVNNHTSNHSHLYVDTWGGFIEFWEWFFVSGSYIHINHTCSIRISKIWATPPLTSFFLDFVAFVDCIVFSFDFFIFRFVDSPHTTHLQNNCCFFSWFARKLLTSLNVFYYCFHLFGFIFFLANNCSTAILSNSVLLAWRFCCCNNQWIYIHRKCIDQRNQN